MVWANVVGVVQIPRFEVRIEFYWMCLAITGQLCVVWNLPLSVDALQIDHCCRKVPAIKVQELPVAGHLAGVPIE